MAFKLSNLHRLVLATRMRDLFDSAPLMILYQSLGNIRPTELVAGLQAELDVAMPGNGIVAAALRPKNSITERASEAGLQPFAHASNILVAWQLQSAAATCLQRQVSTHLGCRLCLNTLKPHP